MSFFYRRDFKIYLLLIDNGVLLQVDNIGLLQGKSPLKEVKWLRVILDEGHCIRNPKAQMTKAVHALNAERRWVVTGTPIQNSMKDLWSVICFLRLEPFLDRQWWVRSIERPISQGDKNALRLVFRILRPSLLYSILIIPVALL